MDINQLLSARVMKQRMGVIVTLFLSIFVDAWFCNYVVSQSTKLFVTRTRWERIVCAHEGLDWIDTE